MIIWCAAELAAIDEIVHGTRVTGGAIDRVLRLREKAHRIAEPAAALHQIEIECQGAATWRRHGRVWRGADTLELRRELSEVARESEDMLDFPWRWLPRKTAADLAGVQPDSLDKWPIKRNRAGGLVGTKSLLLEARRREKVKASTPQRNPRGRFCKAAGRTANRVGTGYWNKNNPAQPVS